VPLPPERVAVQSVPADEVIVTVPVGVPDEAVTLTLKVAVLSCPYVVFTPDTDMDVCVETMVPLTVRVKVHVPVSPNVSATVPVAV
jgi:hypothetical protein